MVQSCTELWQLNRNEVDEPYNKVMGKSSVRQTEGRRECLLAEIWFHAKKECCRFIYFKVADGEVQIRSGKAALCL